MPAESGILAKEGVAASSAQMATPVAETGLGEFRLDSTSNPRHEIRSATGWVVDGQVAVLSEGTERPRPKKRRRPRP